MGLVLIFRRTYGVWIAIVGGAIAAIVSYSVANPDSYPVCKQQLIVSCGERHALLGARSFAWHLLLEVKIKRSEVSITPRILNFNLPVIQFCEESKAIINHHSAELL